MIQRESDPVVKKERVAYSLEPNASGGWAVQAKTGGKTALSKKRGWVAEPSREVPDSVRMFGHESAEDVNETVVNELHDEFEAEWLRLCSVVEGDEHVDLAEAGAHFVEAVESDRKALPYPELDVVFALREPDYDEDNAAIENRIVIAPNATDSVDEYVATTSTLEDRLDRIGSGKESTLQGRFTTSDWAKAFAPLSLRTAQNNVAAGIKLRRLVRVTPTEILYNPIFADAVPPLIEERHHAEGRTSELLGKGPFGPREVATFCQRDDKLKTLTADWQAGAPRALANMAARGVVKTTPDGKYTFHNDFPLPLPGMHTVKELAGVTLPDGRKRESHHVPAKALANAWSIELRSIVDDLPKDENAMFDEAWRPYADAVTARADAFDKAHLSTDGKTLTAILIHPDTHRGTDDAVHKANSKVTSEAILIELENHALVMCKKASDLVLANPQEEHWRDFIDACYKQVRDGELEEGVDPEMAKQELAILEKAFGKDEDRIDQVTERSAENLETTMTTAMTAAFTLDRGRLAVALRRSSNDGDNKEHEGVLTSLEAKHKSSEWLRSLAGPIQPEA